MAEPSHLCGRGGSLTERKKRLDGKAASQSSQEPASQPFELRNTNLSDKKAMFAQNVAKQQEKMKKNPFSGTFNAASARKGLSKDDPNYGRPVAGSKSERRGKNAAKHVNAEVVLLCDMIYQEGCPLPDGTAVISFGDLFQIYTRISNKVVGILLRARKYGLLDFEGEILFQRRDDEVPITLLKPIKEIRDELNEDQDFEVGVCHRTAH